VESGVAIEGIATGLVKIKAPEITGAALSLGYLDAVDATGLTVAGYNRVRGRSSGLSIGLYNSARRLSGIQIGLLNHADNNPAPFRYLPFINVHF
jgi:hypothetical protein